MIESTFGEQSSERTSWSVVYDSRDGSVVHIHQFIGEDTRISEKEARNHRAQLALQVAEQRYDAQYLRVIHAPPKFRLDIGEMCRVDLGCDELVKLTEPQYSYSLREFVERAKAGSARKDIGGNQSKA